MNALIDTASWILLAGGALLSVIGGIGMLRMPDFYTRMHAASVTDTGGMILMLAGLMLQAGLTLVTAKLVFVMLFLLITSPTATHALARAALEDGIEPQVDHDKR
ncbi:monovalent cation/proton antiporter subunit MnhG/PhaG [Salinisphaera shabanensis T35B1]|uniref:Na+-H+ antiporter subunit protein n=1 Tax=Salinisphaera shabanensis E1L3A TaxID=1033802 RepID=U2E6Z0_9GAMM|nr:monovalent cation/H(+) antiporter subunit G [Salinisphaera shabanensis]ERJ19516.1 Na+-H+ antiporter subunit protein [Salinisphaera shabanensis E1L3A]